jgi:hypothetical protein
MASSLEQSVAMFKTELTPEEISASAKTALKEKPTKSKK